MSAEHGVFPMPVIRTARTGFNPHFAFINLPLYNSHGLLYPKAYHVPLILMPTGLFNTMSTVLYAIRDRNIYIQS
jgi:hypothetical protein